MILITLVYSIYYLQNANKGDSELFQDKKIYSNETIDGDNSQYETENNEIDSDENCENDKDENLCDRIMIEQIIKPAEKPIIYIYPEQETIVNAKLGNPENLTCTYPKYDEDEGWKVIAKPNGDLQDLKTEKNYYALYWEGMGTKVYDYSNPKEGFIVEGENTAEFLEEKLETLGLNDREKEEFIVYWLPQMEKNKYNYIRFETKDEIEEEMPLEIEPKPDTVIRVLMDWKALDEKIEIEEQKLESVQRNGYTVVEWGGSELNTNIVR